MNIVTLDQSFPVCELNGEFYFDIEDLAARIGLSQPKRSVAQFIQARKVNTEKWVTNPNGRKWCDRRDLYRFLMHSRAPKAVEWQDYICDVVLPLVDAAGLSALKRLAATKVLAQNKLSPDLYSEIEALVGDETEQFLIDNNAYRVLGYLPPSEVKPAGWSLAEFWEYVEDEGIDNFDTIYCAKYHNSYTQDGKWYAFKDVEFPEEIPEKPEIIKEIPCFSASDLI